MRRQPIGLCKPLDGSDCHCCCYWHTEISVDVVNANLTRETCNLEGEFGRILSVSVSMSPAVKNLKRGGNFTELRPLPTTGHFGQMKNELRGAKALTCLKFGHQGFR